MVSAAIDSLPISGRDDDACRWSEHVQCALQTELHIAVDVSGAFGTGSRHCSPPVLHDTRQ